jgi:hypothetical protein
MEDPHYIQFLTDLLEYKTSRKEIYSRYRDIQFTTEDVYNYIPITRAHIKHVLKRFLNNELTLKQVNDWGEFVKCDSGYVREPGYDDIIEEVLYYLAHDCYREESLMDTKMAMQLINKLDTAPQGTIYSE